MPRPSLPGPALHEAYERGRAAWPGVDLDEATFEAYIAERLAPGEPGEARLAELRTDDLYLACAFIGGERTALDTFEQTFGSVLRQSLSRFELSQAEKQDIEQSLRVALFLKRKIANYSGRGPLHGWLRSVATRAAIDHVDARKPRPEDDEAVLANLPATGDLELRLAAKQFGEQFRTALAETIRAMPADDRTLLAQHYIDDLSIDQLAEVLGVHRATAARRVARLRTVLLEGTRERLRQALQVDTKTFDTLMRMARSELDASVFRLLRQ